MKSTASFRGHPLHPALIPFPLAFLWGAFVADAAGLLLDRSSFWTTGAYLGRAGVIMALVAALPGFVDYLYTVPPASTGKQRATRHMILNLAAVILFAVSWFTRGDAAETPALVVVALEAVAVGLLSAGGWLGGVLVSRNQISVDHRYAGAGKWREVRADVKDGAVLAARADELEIDQLKLVRANGKRLVLARTSDGYAAFDDRCTHRGGSLADGVSICGTVQCPWHGSQFDVRTGAVRAGPAEHAIGTYRVEQRGQDVYIVLGS